MVTSSFVKSSCNQLYCIMIFTMWIWNNLTQYVLVFYGRKFELVESICVDFLLYESESIKLIYSGYRMVKKKYHTPWKYVDKGGVEEIWNLVSGPWLSGPPPNYKANRQYIMDNLWLCICHVFPFLFMLFFFGQFCNIKV